MAWRVFYVNCDLHLTRLPIFAHDSTASLLFAFLSIFLCWVGLRNMHSQLAVALYLFA